MMLHVLFTLSMLPMHLPGSTSVTEAPRILFLPLKVQTRSGEPWDGLASVLALQHKASDKEQLIPLTVVRKKLREYGLSLTGETTLATALLLARDLGADQLLLGTMGETRVQATLYRLDDHSVVTQEWPVATPLTDLTLQLAEFAHVPVDGFAPDEIGFFRQWASSYFAADPEGALTVMQALVGDQLVGWLFLQELLDLFGNPVTSESGVTALIYWRNLFTEKAHPLRALEASKLLLEKRHNPNDFIVHAQILARLEERDEACDWLKKAQSYGFTTPESKTLLDQCK